MEPVSVHLWSSRSSDYSQRDLSCVGVSSSILVSCSRLSVSGNDLKSSWEIPRLPAIVRATETKTRTSPLRNSIASPAERDEGTQIRAVVTAICHVSVSILNVNTLQTATLDYEECL